jgi:transmembrane sensor
MSTINATALNWIARQSERELTNAERAELEAWCAADIRHHGAYVRAVAINFALNQARVQDSLRPTPRVTTRVWDDTRVRHLPSRRSFLMYGGLAAALALIVGPAVLPPLPASQSKTLLATAKGEFRKVPLADQSIASINSDSIVEVDLSDRLRQVSLKKGEAWFEVAKDKSRPFVVDAGAARIRAVGTAFGVRRAPNGAEVLVTEGTVEVWSNDGAAAKRLVTVGERAFVADRAAKITVTLDPEDVERQLAWREGRLIFQNRTLDDAVADFNRYSPKRIVIADAALKRKTLVGQYQINAPERFAEDVSETFSVPIDIGTDLIVIGRAKP